MWAFSPISGDGAKTTGGRFNPKGVPALYLAHSVDGMFAEMGHGFASRFNPLTVCSYEVDVDDIVDLRTDADRTVASINLADLACAWLSDFNAGREPPSWTVAKKLIAGGVAGVLVPSFAVGAKPGAHNLVLWKWGDALPHFVRVIDPEDKLPKNQDSWPASPKVT
jgi:RES domain-containing protein